MKQFPLLFILTLLALEGISASFLASTIQVSHMDNPNISVKITKITNVALWLEPGAWRLHWLT